MSQYGVQPALIDSSIQAARVTLVSGSGSTAIQTLTIPVSGQTTGSFKMEESALLGLSIPALDGSCTVSVSGTVSPNANPTCSPLFNSAGTQILNVPATAGNFTWGADALEALVGCTHINVGVSAPQNVGAKTIYLLQRRSR